MQVRALYVDRSIAAPRGDQQRLAPWQLPRAQAGHIVPSSSAYMPKQPCAKHGQSCRSHRAVRAPAWLATTTTQEGP